MLTNLIYLQITIIPITMRFCDSVRNLIHTAIIFKAKII